ncbi:MAG: hypothetical protein JKX85_06915, partial [Phycisphaeraceae bacterium]|nr:hypothetical protein [Phycisphaeraceae bacterium]
ALSMPDKPDSRFAQTRVLAEKYYHQMLDYHIQPQSPALYAYYNYDIQEQGEGLAPKLTNWDFGSGFDKAMKEFVMGRDMPLFTVGRSNGHLMNKFWLNNGKFYSYKRDSKNPNAVYLPKKEFAKLVGAYWEAFAKHLDELGILDRAIFVIGECGLSTFDAVCTYILDGMKSQPHAKKIKIGHTAQTVSPWTHRTSKGTLLMDEILDVPMSFNDEHYNYFEPEWNSRFVKPKHQQWVYYVQTDHLVLEHAGLSTLVTPLKLRNFGVEG